MKRTNLFKILVCIAMVIFSLSLSAVATELPIAEEEPADTTGLPSSQDLDGEDADETVSLLATVTQIVTCKTDLVLYGTEDSPVYLYRSPTTTEYYNKAGDKFTSETVVRAYEYYVLSDGTRRYKFTAFYCDTDNLITYYIPLSSKVVIKEVHHTFEYETSHPHTGTCECGETTTIKESGCLECYPSRVVFNANGGEGAPSSLYVTASPAKLPSTIPTRFPYTFDGWSVFFDEPDGEYAPEEEITIQANSKVTLYAVWDSAVTKTASFSSVSTKFIYVDYKGGEAYIAFTPSEWRTYVFKSVNTTGDPRAYLYASDGTLLASNDDYSGSNFRITYELLPDKTYYFKVKWYSSSKTGPIEVQLLAQYDINYNANGGYGAPSAQVKTVGEDLTLSSTVPSREGYVFAGWATSPSAIEATYQPRSTYTRRGDTTLYAVWAYPSGACGDDARWEYRDQCLYISGTGEMEDYTSANDVPWGIYKDNIAQIEIEDGITSVGSYAFSDCTKIEDIVLPVSVHTVGAYAFHNCNSLKSISLPERLAVLGVYSFNNCSALTEITIPYSVETIGAYAFYGCASLMEMDIPYVLALEEYAFAQCTNMERVRLPYNLLTIPAHLFEGNGRLSEVVIPNTVTSIGEFAFSDCSTLTSIIIPSSVTEIDRAAFSRCTALRTVTIPDSVTSIGTSIFAYISDNVLVRCYIDTAIYEYVIENDIAYELMSWGALEAPTFTRKAIAGGVIVELSAPKGDIYYTINGATPTTADMLYTAPITAQSNFTIKAIAVSTGWEDSPVAHFDTAIEKVSTPYASQDSGSVLTPGTQVSLHCDTEDAEIWYTLNGDVPKESDLYTGPITVTEDTTIYALAVREGMLTSALTVFRYEVSENLETPVITTLEASSITDSSAILAAQIDEESDILYAEFVYYEKNNSKVRYTVPADENNRAILTGLSPDTEYWFQARAVNHAGWNTGYICTFMTEPSENTKPTALLLDPTYISLNVGKSKTILATVLPQSAANRTIYWSSEDTTVATVDKNGTVTAVGLGNTRIKATTLANRLVAYCNVDVLSTEIAGTFDFSELNMITNSSSYDIHGYDHSVNDGGNALMASAYLTRWDGVVLEGQDPYPDSPSGVKYHEIDSMYHVQNILYLPYRSHSLDNDELKNAVMKYGAVYTALKINYNYFSDNQTNYYLPENVSKVDGGHAVAIVGWDDNYPRTAFAVTAPANGAFICKNSWGTDVGDDGYFYVSYYDKYIARANSNDFNTVFYDLQSGENYNKIYQYDYLGPVANYTLPSKKAYVANVFPESGSVLSSDETLAAVSFYNYTPGTAYEVYVVEDYRDKDSLTNLGDPVHIGVMDYAGYFTFNLDEPIVLDAGTRFAVVIRYISSASSNKIFVELPTTIYSKGSQISHSSNARANTDESYISNNGKSWSDFTSFVPNGNVCVKAFTATTDADVLLQGIDNLGRSYEDDTILSVDEWKERGINFNDRLESADDLWLLDVEENSFGLFEPTIIPDLNTNNNYSEGAVLPVSYDLRKEGCVTPVKQQGDIGSCWSFATYASLESAIKKASASSVSVTSDGLSQAPGAVSQIELNTDGLILSIGRTEQIIATLFPYDSESAIRWSSSNHEVASVSAYGLVTALGVGNADITASTLDGKLSVQCAVTVTEPVNLRSIDITLTTTELHVGETRLLEASLKPSNAGTVDLLWYSSNDSVAFIDEYGVLTAKQRGTTEITVSTKDGTVTDSFILTVTGGYPVYSAITENDLIVGSEEIRGSLSLEIGDTDTNDTVCVVFVAFYDLRGQCLSVLTDTANLSFGKNQICFEDVFIANTDATCTVQIFVCDAETNVPIATPVYETLIREGNK